MQEMRLGIKNMRGLLPLPFVRRHGGIPFHPVLFGGARLQIDRINRSDYYSLNFATLYLRYMFDAHTGYPPDPVKPYSRFCAGIRKDGSCNQKIKCEAENQLGSVPEVC